MSLLESSLKMGTHEVGGKHEKGRLGALSRQPVGAIPPPWGEQPARSRRKGCWGALMLVGVLSEVKRPVPEGRCCGRVRNEMKVQRKQTSFIVVGWRRVAAGQAVSGQDTDPETAPPGGPREVQSGFQALGKGLLSPSGEHQRKPRRDVLTTGGQDRRVLSSTDNGGLVGRQGQPSAEETRCEAGERDWVFAEHVAAKG